MAITYTDNGGGAPNGSDLEFTYTFPVIQTEDVKVALNGVTQATTKYAVDNVSNPTKITFNNTSVDSSVQESTGAPKSGVRVRVYRETTVGKANGDEDPKAVFAAGSSIRAIDLNANQEQSLMAIHELQTRPIETEDIQGDAIVGSLIADSQIDSEHYVDGSIDRQHLEPDIIDNSKLADNAVQTENILNGTIVDADINASAEIEVYKLKDGAANQVLVTQSDGTTVNWSSNINLPGNLDVTGTLDSTGNVDFDANLNVDGNTTLNNLSVSGNSTLTGNITVNGGSTLNNLRIGVTTGNEIDTVAGSLNLDSASGQTTIDDNLNVTGACQVSGVNVVTESGTQTLTNKTLTTPVINDLSGTAVVTSGTSTSDNKIYSAKRSDELYYRKGTADDIEESGVPWSGNDSTIATTAAIDARIVDILDDVGGFVPLLNETKIPQLHPEYVNKDTADRVGTILSIGTLTTTYTPSGGTVTIQASDLTNHSVNATITDCGSTVLASGFGVLVETKAQTDSQYAAGPSFKFHRLVPKATEVTTVAGKATEIGRLGTADAVADMAILGTADVVADLNTLATADIVADMNMLATSDVISDMNTLAVTDVINDMDTVATNVTNVNNVGGSIANVNTTAGSIANVNTVAGAIANVNTTAGSISNVNTTAGSISNVNSVASNMANVNNFADRYQIASNNPSTDGGGNALAAGDLYFNTSANELKVYNGSSWQGGVTASGSFASTTGNTFTGDNVYNDGVKALFGTDSDLEIFSLDGSPPTNYFRATSGSNMVIQQQGNGARIRIAATNIHLMNHVQNETYLDGVNNGAVSLYYDNNKKFETTSTGIKIFSGSSGLDDILTLDSTGNSQGHGGKIGFRRAGDLRAEIQAVKVETSHNETDIVFKTTKTGSLFEALRIVGDTKNIQIPNDTGKLQLGTSQDLQIYHNGTDSHLDNNTGELALRSDTIRLRGKTGNETLAVFEENGAAKLYHDNSKKFETTSGGGALTGQLSVGLNTSSGIDLFHFGNTNFIKPNNGSLDIITPSSNANIARFIPGGAVELWHNASKKLETSSTGVTIDGRLNMTEGIDIPDGGDNNTSLSIGSGNDLRLYHDGNNSYIKERGTGNLNIQSANTVEIEKDNGTDIARFHPDGEVELFYDGSRKLNTTSTGVALHGLSNGTGNSTLYYNSSTGQVLYGATPATDLVTDTSPELGGNLDAGTRNIEFDDNGKLRFGTGNDFEIYHKSADNGNYIESQNSRNLFLEQDQIFILNEAGNEYMIHGVANGAVSLYYNNSKKLETDNSGVTIGGTTAERLKIDGSVGDCILASSGAEIQFTRNNQNNISCTGDSSTLRLNGDSKLMANFIANGAAELYHNGTKKLETTTEGVLIGNGGLHLGDNNKIEIGNSDDLQIYHDGSNSAIKNLTNRLDIYANTFHISNLANSEDMARFNNNGDVQLYYDYSKKFETTSIGAQVTGQFVATQAITAQTYMQGTSSNGGLKLYSDSTASMGVILDTGDDFRPTHNNQSDLGAPSYRWRNIYTNDLNLSNEGSSNDMDGTWGDWTIQEGKSDLFLKNNRSGKKYKFNLTEVS